MHHSLVLLAVLALSFASLGTSQAARADERVILAQAAEEDAAGGAVPEPAPAPRRRPPPGIEEIVVQAGESEAAADMEAGDSVTGFDASDLEALGAQSIEDLAGFTPNLEIVTAGATTPTFFIRGVGLNDFSPNSSGAVAIYQDDVPKNAPALQLGTLFDIQGVNVLRGPQGTGPARNASAGAIKIYSTKPSGNFGGYLSSEIGNYNSRDFQGAVEMPLYQDLLSGRFAFRFTRRDGWMKNRCGTNPRSAVPYTGGLFNNELVGEGGFSTCGEQVWTEGGLNRQRGGTSDGFTPIPDDVEDYVNNTNNWATRGILRFQPTLDQDWLLTFNLARRDQLATLGQSIGTGQTATICDPSLGTRCTIQAFGSLDAEQYMPIELIRKRNRINRCFVDDGASGGTLTGEPGCTNRLDPATVAEINRARLALAKDLVLDSKPREGDFNRTGDITNDVWGVSLKGDIALGGGLTFTAVSSYDTYDRFNDIDLDFTPNQLFEIVTDDEGFQVVEDLQLAGPLPGEFPVNWRVGGFALYEELQADVDVFLPRAVTRLATTYREWEQKLWSAAGYVDFDWDFWDDFTLDGGFRYNWENKRIDMVTFSNGFRPEANPDRRPPGRIICPGGRFEFINAASPNNCGELSKNDVWQSPTGTVRLTYRFREDTHAFWKYTHGWKGGHYNTTVASGDDITVGKPESIDAFEVGLRGSWFNGRLGLNSSLFHYQYSDYQIFTVIIPEGGTPSFVVLNASDAEVYGGELEMTARPIPGLFLEARLSWLESQFLDFQQQQAQTITLGDTFEVQTRELDFSGNPLLNSPEFKLSLTVEQTLPLGRYGSLTARWDGAWTDDTYYDASAGLGTPTIDEVDYMPENTIGQAAFWLQNARLGYRTPDGGVEIAAWVRNLTDEVYKSFAFDASQLQTTRTTIHFLGEPRTYGVSLNVTF